MKHKVVACIPTKNTGWLLKDTLPHLSTFCDKIIISDDASTDDTEDICAENPSVEYQRRPAREPGDRQGALQRQELLDAAYRHDPDYFLFLDADEMPSPDIVDWIESLDTRENEKANLWTFPWVHLWGDDQHYRVDSYVSRTGGVIHWDPFDTNYRKGFLARNIPGYELKYDITQHRVRPSNQPANVPKPWIDVQENPVIIHYGKISEYFTSEQNWKDRAQWDKYEKGADPLRTLMHHRYSNSEETLRLRKINPQWMW